MPLHTTDALILRTYKLGESDRIVVFLTRDRGKKRGVAKNARGTGAPPTRGDVTLVDGKIDAIGTRLERPTGARIVAADGLALAPGFIDMHSHADFTLPAYPDAINSVSQGVTSEIIGNCGYSPAPLSAVDGEALGYVSYFAELIDEWAPEADPNEALFRLGVSMTDAIAQGVPIEPLARYFEFWLMRLQGVYELDRRLSEEAQAFLVTARSSSPFALAGVAVSRVALRELEAAHRALISMHLEKDLKSVRVLREMRSGGPRD